VADRTGLTVCYNFFIPDIAKKLGLTSDEYMRSFLTMPGSKSELQILAAFAVLMSFATAVGCRGFFVQPTLTALTVDPAEATVQVGKTTQMIATGTYDDGSTSTNVANLSWSISGTDATINGSGLVTGVTVSTGPDTVTASAGAVTGTASLTVVLANVTGIMVTPSSQTATVGGASVPYSAQATVAGQSPTDVTGSATWTVTQNGTVASDIECTYEAPLEQCSAQTGAVSGSYTVSASYAGIVGTATLIVP